MMENLENPDGIWKTWDDWGYSHDLLLGGFNLPLWKMMEFVSWDDEIPNNGKS